MVIRERDSERERKKGEAEIPSRKFIFLSKFNKGAMRKKAVRVTSVT